MAFVKIYNGYGHAKDLTVFGHVLEDELPQRLKGASRWQSVKHIISLFKVKPLAGITVKIFWADIVLETVTEDDGFFKAEWQSHEETQAGWHQLSASAYDANNNCIGSADGKLFIPHITQYAFISDIDDTILISHSSTILRRLRTLLTKNPQTRLTFDGAAAHYQLLAKSFTEDEVRNPFFYVSSSEWNLYDDIQNFLLHKQMPEGILLLSQLKLLRELVKTGKTKHEGKILRIARVLKSFPNQQFILSGDNSQKDPQVYAEIAEKYSSNIFAVYIRNVVPAHSKATLQTLEKIKQLGVHTCQYENSAEAMAHSKKIGLISEATAAKSM